MKIFKILIFAEFFAAQETEPRLKLQRILKKFAKVADETMGVGPTRRTRLDLFIFMDLLYYWEHLRDAIFPKNIGNHRKIT